MKWQRARDIKNGYLLWVEIGKPFRHCLKEINKEDKTYGGFTEGLFYLTNLKNPINDPRFPFVCVRADEMELLPEFTDNAEPDNEWFN